MNCNRIESYFCYLISFLSIESLRLRQILIRLTLLRGPVRRAGLIPCICVEMHQVQFRTHNSGVSNEQTSAACPVLRSAPYGSCSSV